MSDYLNVGVAGGHASSSDSSSDWLDRVEIAWFVIPSKRGRSEGRSL